jgi:methyl-accepting chemotaxis protein
LVLLIVAVVAYRSTIELIDDNGWVDHTYRIRHRFDQLLTQSLDAESAERGYVITGDNGYLEPYRPAVTALKATLADLRKLVADNTSQQRRLDTISPLVADLMSQFQRVIDLRRTAGFDAAVQAMSSGKAQALLDQFRSLIAEGEAEEARLLQSRIDDAKDSAQWALSIILWGSAGGIVLVGLIGWLITRSLTRQIGTAVQHVQSSSSELQAVANQQAAGLREQATAMSEITTTMTELLATSRQIAESARRVAQIAEQTSGGARSGQGSVDLARDSIVGIRRQVDQIVAYMLELGKKSQEIGAVLDIVLELAEQTNILAINATIEAAGAGDSGKRFSVVADEIRKLADRVGGSAKEIRTLIDEVRSAVNTTVMATETGSKAVDTGSQQFNDVASGFRQIADLVITTTDAAREIELSTKQQSTAVEQVNVAIANVAQASHETESSAGQTLQTASELTHLSANLARIIRSQAAAA